MFPLFQAGKAAVRGVAGSLFLDHRRQCAAIVAVSFSLSGCLSTAPLLGPDPADPAAKIQAVRYRSIIAPYTPMRPAEPADWSGQNRRAAPAPRSDQRG